ncbi:helix-turn-helix transcriptional regulator [Herbiconiux ginsengi]|uniref:Regulatory protein, luxR family n=1 Tax=Herbiconiux ginsengi TaxID=381665 RepID=A0A1H3RYS4_9MICO|nr:LuxR C-terminal-related transcriptional regulator [Herbiconiux ginsengi]SDZ30421.1 regulatory protein, luxR family [Herbiconiux ginsengi]
MDRESRAAAAEPDRSASDTGRWLRDVGALLALPALWVDHEPPEIAEGLLSVLFGVLDLDGGYARFEDPGGRALETWRPSGPAVPSELKVMREAERTPASALTTSAASASVFAWDSAPAAGSGAGTVRVASLPLSLPWGTALVVVSAARADFPTELETHQLRVAASQAAIAIHAARRLAREHAARAVAEEALAQQNRLLRSLVDDVEPSLAEIARRVHEASRVVTETGTDPAHRSRSPGHASALPHTTEGAGTDSASATARDLVTLSRRELEVLGLLAQGLSNKEIAGVMWLSDRTVERHITGLYRKIGVARRSEATAFALRHGVV